ncbi:MAG: hypothetical protein EZS28_018343 [Streblomastix strix]|uniref:Uncharacterized protein n=1 Tax=Streblomastix strix TaxID=222440 RepID=A0A5J4VU78_9EUKA|nr:MAG: hypothetical protein EZS28_018343 [Streblomastix strix]
MPSSENPLISIQFKKKILHTSATGPEESRPHCMEDDFAPYLSFSVRSLVPSLMVQGKAAIYIVSLV